MIRRLRQQQQKAQEPKHKNSSNSNTGNTMPSSSSNNAQPIINNFNSYATYRVASPKYGHTLTTPDEDRRTDASFSRPPPLVEIETPLKGLSRMTSSGVVAPPNAIAPSSLQQLSRDNRNVYTPGSSRYTPSKLNKESRVESPMSSSKHSSGYRQLQGIILFSN